MNRRIAAAALGLGLLPAAAMAEGWTIKDLGSVPTESGCVNLAWDVFDRYRDARSLGDLQKTEWVVYGYDLSSGAYDAIITCNYGPNDTTRATLAVHNSDDGYDGERGDIADRLERYWEQMK